MLDTILPIVAILAVLFGVACVIVGPGGEGDEGGREPGDW